MSDVQVAISVETRYTENKTILGHFTGKTCAYSPRDIEL